MLAGRRPGVGDPGGQLVEGDDLVDRAGGGGGGHPGHHAGGLVLGQGRPAGTAQLQQAGGVVAAHPGEDDPGSPGAEDPGDRGEQVGGRRPVPVQRRALRSSTGTTRPRRSSRPSTWPEAPGDGVRAAIRTTSTTQPSGSAYSRSPAHSRITLAGALAGSRSAPFS